MPSPVILDPTVIAELRSLDPAPDDGLLRELTAIFVHDTPPRLTEMERSLDGADAVAFGRAAHSIKGSAANLGARELHRAADEAERCARSGDLANGRARLDEIRAEFTRAREALGVMVGDVGQR